VHHMSSKYVHAELALVVLFINEDAVEGFVRVLDLPAGGVHKAYTRRAR
jgi:hypothetical protein